MAGRPACLCGGGVVTTSTEVAGAEEVTLAELEAAVRSVWPIRWNGQPSSQAPRARKVAEVIYPLMERHARWVVANASRADELLDRLEAMVTDLVGPDACAETGGTA